MTSFSQLIQQIKNRLSIVDVIQPSVPLQRKGSRFLGLCPFHLEKTASFNVDPIKGTYHCFGCGQHGDHFSFLTDYKGMTFIEALQGLAERTGQLSVFESIQAASRAKFLSQDGSKETALIPATRAYELLDVAAQWCHFCLERPSYAFARSYLMDRGITLESIKVFAIGFAPPSESLVSHLMTKGFKVQEIEESGLLFKGREAFQGRITFPIYDLKKRVIAFGGRIIKESDKPKYLNSNETLLFKKNTVLFGQHSAFKNTNRNNAPLVVEGYLDVISLHQFGFTTAVAPLGTACSEEHIKKLWQRHPSPVFCFDGDHAGRQAAYRMIKKIFPLIEPGFSAEFVLLAEGEDPDGLVHKYGAEAFQNVLDSKRNLIDVFWELTLHTLNISLHSSPEEKTIFKKTLFTHIDLIRDRDLRDFYSRDINERIKQFFFSPTSMRDAKKTPINHVKILQSINKIKKSDKITEILFAYLKKNPKLIERVQEMLAEMDNLTHRLAEFREFLCANQFFNTTDLEEKITKNGFDDVGASLDQEFMNSGFLYVAQSTDDEQMFQLWKSLWSSCYAKPKIGKEISGMKSDLKKTMTEVEWQKWQKIKLQDLLGIK